MLRKLLPCPHRHPSQTRTLTLTLTVPSRSKTHSPSPPPDPYDPPFSPIPKSPPPKPSNSLPKTLTPNPIKPPAPFHSDLPFDFRYSYSETDPSVRPIGFREPPRFSPFGPGRLDRKWDGAAAPSPSPSPVPETAQAGEVAGSADRRNSVLGEPLTEEEIEELVERYRHNDCSRQINLGFKTAPPWPKTPKQRTKTIINNTDH